MKSWIFLVIILMLVSPVLTVWQTTKYDDGFRYDLDIAPLYFDYGVYSKTYGNETKFGSLFNMTEKEWYANSTIRENLRGLASAGLFYTVMCLVGALTFYVGFKRNSRKVLYFAFGLYFIGYLVFIVYLLNVLAITHHHLYYVKIGQSDMPSIGFFIPYLAGLFTFLISGHL